MYKLPPGLYPAKLLCPWNSPGKNTGLGCHSLLQGIFPTQGSNPGFIPGWGRFPGEENGNPVQYSCLMNSMDKRSLVGYGMAKSQTQLSD